VSRNPTQLGVSTGMRSVLLLAVTGCVSQIHPVGGTPGPRALACSDPTCERVVDALEIRRRNIGGWCGTPNLRAALALSDLGPTAVPFLVRAFDDRDTEVAELAMRASVGLGAIDPVIAWCRDVVDLVRLDMCRDTLP
jgi:hypothetical protein